jgi:hypothetical protein
MEQEGLIGKNDNFIDDDQDNTDSDNDSDY